MTVYRAFLKESTDRLTDEMKSWLDSKPIVIYVSHGTVVDLSASAIENYVRGFERLRGMSRNHSGFQNISMNLFGLSSSQEIFLFCGR